MNVHAQGLSRAYMGLAPLPVPVAGIARTRSVRVGTGGGEPSSPG